jgi:hypothetical protein
MQLSQNIKKCIFCISLDVLLGYIKCKEGLLVDPTKIAVISILSLLSTMLMLCFTLGHIVYYWWFIRGYAKLTTPMEEFL